MPTKTPTTFPESENTSSSAPEPGADFFREAAGDSREDDDDGEERGHSGTKGTGSAG